MRKCCCFFSKALLHFLQILYSDCTIKQIHMKDYIYTKGNSHQRIESWHGCHSKNCWITKMTNRPWWPSSLRCYIKFKQREFLGPRFESPLGITVPIIRNFKQFLAIQIAGCWVTIVTYNIELREDGAVAVVYGLGYKPLK